MKGVIIIKFQPENFKEELTTVWSFPNRGEWATHSGSYRGNWSPYIPRNLIIKYSQEDNWILDQFMGSGTTLVEAKLLGRNAIGVDVNENAIQIAKKRLEFNFDTKSQIYIKHGNASNLNFLKNSSIDLICTHPPYANIIRYSKDICGDISLLSLEQFLSEMDKVAGEAYRVLKRGKICAIMIGDIRKYGKVVPLGFQVMQRFLGAGFVNKEIIIKEQHNCKSTVYWSERKNNFLLLAHEYIFVFVKE